MQPANTGTMKQRQSEKKKWSRLSEMLETTDQLILRIKLPVSVPKRTGAVLKVIKRQLYSFDLVV